MGLQPVTRDAAPAGKQYPYVLFAAPPSGSEDYPGAVSRGGLWLLVDVLVRVEVGITGRTGGKDRSGSAACQCKFRGLGQGCETGRT
jgi:hypothetical protein